MISPNALQYVQFLCRNLTYFIQDGHKNMCRPSCMTFSTIQNTNRMGQHDCSSAGCPWTFGEKNIGLQDNSSTKYRTLWLNYRTSQTEFLLYSFIFFNRQEYIFLFTERVLFTCEQCLNVVLQRSGGNFGNKKYRMTDWSIKYYE